MPRPGLDDPTELPSPLVYLRATELTPMQSQPARASARGSLAVVSTRTPPASQLAALVRERSHVLGPARPPSRTDACARHCAGHGVCQDQAHVFIAACRANGVPARYVSGYFYAPDSPRWPATPGADGCIDVASRRWLSVDVTTAA
jgi:transglutaminase-like putative cysteine protease